jgi:hypothetical protein
MANKQLNLTVGLNTEQTTVSVGEVQRSNNRIAITVTALETVQFDGFGARGSFRLVIPVGGEPQDLVSESGETDRMTIEGPDIWGNPKGYYNSAVREYVYEFTLPKTIIEAGHSLSLMLRSFVVLNVGKANLKAIFSITGYDDSESEVAIDKQPSSAFELLSFEANPPYIVTDKQKEAFLLSWQTSKAIKLELRKNDQLIETFEPTSGLVNDERCTLKQYLNTGTTHYQLTAWSKADSDKSQSKNIDVTVLNPGWHERKFPSLGIPSALCADGVNLWAVFIGDESGLFASKHPYTLWDRVTPSLPEGMTSSSCVAFNNHIWLVGGSSVHPDVCSNQVCSYSPYEGEWKVQTADWPARMGHACVVFKDKLWVLGGMDADGNPLNDVYCMDKRGIWQRYNKEVAWTARCMHAAAAYNDSLWIYGGLEEPFGNAKTDMWILQDGKDWTPYEIPNALKDALPISNALQVVAGKLHLMGWFRDNNSSYAKQWKLQYRQKTWSEVSGAKPWNDQGANSHSLSGASFQDLLFLRSLNSQLDEKSSSIYVYKP